MDLGLRDKVVLVTGAAGGIGREVVSTLKAEGARVVSIDRVEGPANCDASVVVDLAAPGSEARCVEEAIGRFGRIDALIHCAGISRPAYIGQTQDTVWNQVMDVNLNSLFRLCRALEPHLIASIGAVASIASFAGKRGTLFGDNASYTTSKAGVIGLTHALALEWARHGVRVNAVAPGPVDSPMLRELPKEKLAQLLGFIPLGRLPGAQDVADALVFLISARAASITGEITDVNGGLYLD